MNKIVLTAGILVLIVFTFSMGAVGYHLFKTYFDNQENKESQIYFNGTMYGRNMTIGIIQEGLILNGVNADLPVFDNQGNLTFIKFGRICEQLNQGGS